MTNRRERQEAWARALWPDDAPPHRPADDTAKPPPTFDGGVRAGVPRTLTPDDAMNRHLRAAIRASRRDPLPEDYDDQPPTAA